MTHVTNKTLAVVLSMALRSSALTAHVSTSDVETCFSGDLRYLVNCMWTGILSSYS